MKRFILFILAISAISLSEVFAQKIKGSGNVIKETRDLSGFIGIRARTIVDVELRQGKFSVEVEAEDNVLEYVSTRVVKEKLIIELDDELKLKSEIRPKVYVQMPDITFVDVSDVAGLSTKSVVKIEKLKILKNIYFTASILSSAIRLQRVVSSSTSILFTTCPSRRFSSVQHRCARSIRYIVAHMHTTGLRK